MAHDFYALISDDSPRAMQFQRVFGSLLVPIQSPIPMATELPGLGRQMVVLIAVDQLTDDQRGRLALDISDKFDLPLAEVIADLQVVGCPIRMGDDVYIEIRNALKYSS